MLQEIIETQISILDFMPIIMILAILTLVLFTMPKLMYPSKNTKPKKEKPNPELKENIRLWVNANKIVDWEDIFKNEIIPESEEKNNV